MDHTRVQSGDTAPAWAESVSPESTPLAQTAADVIVLGAGIAGLSVAYHLLRSGRSVIVLDHGKVGAGETARSSAHLSNALDDRYTFLERAHGKDGAKLAAESHRAGIESIAEICERERIQCAFERVSGYLYADDEAGLKTLERELEAARRAGLDVEMLAQVPGSIVSAGALRFADQAQFDPRAYLMGLARAVKARGGALYTERTFSQIEEQDGVRVTLNTGEKLSADALVVATNAPVQDNISLHTKQAPYRSYVIGLELDPGALDRGLYWDLADPYHYLRWLDGKVLLIGGEDHRVGHEAAPKERFSRLEAWARERFPSAGVVRSRWSGQVLEPNDGLAFIGPSTVTRGNSYVVTGDSGNGLTHGALAGILLADLITGRENPWARLYDPTRSTVHGLGDALNYARENATVAVSYGDWITPAAARDVELAPGEGRVVQDGLRKLAVSVDAQGVRRVCSAVCPHLYAVVRWNAAEQSWDCPAHGSRFAPDGSALIGPSAKGLTAEGDVTDEGATPDQQEQTMAAKKKSSGRARKSAPKKSTAKKSAAKKSPTKKSAAKKSATKKTTAKKAPAKKSGAKKKGASKKYGRTAAKKVEKTMKERKAGTLRSGGSGAKVKSRKQAIAIGLSEARKRGAKVPPKKG